MFINTLLQICLDDIKVDMMKSVLKMLTLFS
jgi:hypothetical protein